METLPIHLTPAMAINLGKTRADHFLDAKVENDLDEVLQLVLA